MTGPLTTRAACAFAALPPCSRRPEAIHDPAATLFIQWQEAWANLIRLGDLADDAHRKPHYEAAHAAMDAAGRRVEHIEAAMLAAPATTLAGIIAKLSVAAVSLTYNYVAVDEPKDIEDRLLLSALDDAKRLAGDPT